MKSGPGHSGVGHESILLSTGTLPARVRIRRVDRSGFLADTTSPDALRYVGFGREIEGAELREVFVAVSG